MAEEKKEKWMNLLAVSTVVFAVCATLSTFKGGGYSTKSLLNQSHASDQWNFYQAKSIKGYLYEIQKENLELEAERVTGSHAGADTARIHRMIAAYGEKISKYDKEKKEIKVKAEEFEANRDEARKHSQEFGMAVIFLQVSILLSSIAALTKKKPVWYLSLGTGLAGIFYFLNGFFLWIS